jgi:hypothetical protein
LKNQHHLLTTLLVVYSAVASAQIPVAEASTPAITRIAFLGDSVAHRNRAGEFCRKVIPCFLQ